MLAWWDDDFLTSIWRNCSFVKFCAARKLNEDVGICKSSLSLSKTIKISSLNSQICKNMLNQLCWVSVLKSFFREPFSSLSASSHRPEDVKIFRMARIVYRTRMMLPLGLKIINFLSFAWIIRSRVYGFSDTVLQWNVPPPPLLPPSSLNGNAKFS